MPRMNRVACLILIALGSAAVPGRADDDFDRLEGADLRRIVDREDQARSALGFREIGRLPNVLPGIRSPLVVVRTNDRGLSRLLISPALRKRPQGQGDPLPVLILDRFATYEEGETATRRAQGRDVLLFEGFEFDLDTGQVVPEGQGGDLKLTAGTDGGPTLAAVGEARLFTPMANPAPERPGPGKPSPGRSVVPTDFNGRFRLDADGQWHGLLELEVDDQGRVGGRFQTDLNGTIYPVEGRVSAETPQKVEFRVIYPRTEQAFKGWIFTEGKNAIAGTVTLLDREFGFYAVREAPGPR